MSHPLSTGVPRVIYSLWLQGLEEAPPMVKTCLASWQALNPGWEVVLLHEGNLAEHAALEGLVGGEPRRTRQALSDLIRVNLLARHGGVWVDATCLCRRPLDDWLPTYTRSGFFAFAAPGPDRLVASWFLASRPGDPLTARWCAASNAYWADNDFRNFDRGWLAYYLGKLLNRRAATTRFWFRAPVRRILKVHPYFWFHYLFAEVVREDAASRAVWEATPRYEADDVLSVPGLGRLRPHLLEPASDAVRASLEQSTRPFTKLDWRYDGEDNAPDSILACILAEGARA